MLLLALPKLEKERKTRRGHEVRKTSFETEHLYIFQEWPHFWIGEDNRDHCRDHGFPFSVAAPVHIHTDS